MDAYSLEIEHTMQRYYHSLSEKDRRRYAAIEAIKLGHGGGLATSQNCSIVIQSRFAVASRSSKMSKF